MANVTLVEAGKFIAEEARQLAVLNILEGLDAFNLEGYREAAKQTWQKARSGWHRQLDLFGDIGYDRRKKAVTGRMEPGILTGGWQKFRLLQKADITLESRKGNPYVSFISANPTATEKNIHRQVAGGVMEKPWVEYPQRPIDVSKADFTPGHGAYIPACVGMNFNAIMKQLPLTGYGLNWRRIAAKGKKIGSVSRRGGAKLTGRLAKVKL